MARFAIKKDANRFSPIAFAADIKLECADCGQCYKSRPSKRPYLFSRCAGKDEKGLDARVLLKRGLRGPGRRKKVWTAGQETMLRILVDVFGEKHLPISQAIFDFGPEFLRKKAAELTAVPASPRFFPLRTPLINDELKETPNLSTADKPNCLALQATPYCDAHEGPRFTPRIVVQEGLRFTPLPERIEALNLTPQSSHFPQLQTATPNGVRNPFNVCKFPEFELSQAWEQPETELFSHQYAPNGLSAILSSAATPLARSNVFFHTPRPCIERI